MRKRISLLAGVGLVTVMSFAVIQTGAYFTDTNGPAPINNSLGSVAVNVNGDPVTAPAIDFTNLMPGEVKSASIMVQNTGTGTEDIYLVFDDANGAWSAFNTLGAYGTFTIDGTVYDNLNNHYPWGTDSSGQFINSKDPASGCYMVPRPAQIKFLPHFIKIATLTPTASKTFDLAFNYHACMTAGQGSAGLPLNYSVVAFQSGVNPADPFNGAGKISPLSLPAGWYQDR